MKLQVSTLLSAVALCGTLFSSGSVMAQGTWDFGGSTCNPSGSPSSASCLVGTVTSTITAWGNTGTGGAFQQGNLAAFDPNGFGAYTGTIDNATGAGNTATLAQHAFDNVSSGCSGAIVSGNSGLSTANGGCGGSVEAMLLSFNSRVSLSQVKIGFSATDADLSVYRWDGAGSVTSLTGTAAVLGTGSLGSSWTLISSNDMDLLNPFNTGNTGYSSTFLITTYFGAGATNLDSGNDAFKILNITANVCSTSLSSTGNGATCRTPEPGSFALAGLALAGVGFMRRKKAK